MGDAGRHPCERDYFGDRVRQLLDHLGFRLVVFGEAGRQDVTAEGNIAGGSVRVRGSAHRSRQSVPVEVVRRLRSRLDPMERGLLITTATFSSAAEVEARTGMGTPIWLVDGQQLVDAVGDVDDLALGSAASQVPVDATYAGALPPAIDHRPRRERTPTGRVINTPIAAHFAGDRSALLPTFDALVGAVLEEHPAVDYFAIKRHIVFAEDGDRQPVLALVTVQAKRLELRLRLPPSVAYSERLRPSGDSGW
jgi:hypothetical protein